jgi:predicted RNA-binding protein with PIN domain
MRFLIDGYNVLHALWPAEGRRLRARAWPRFRQRLLDRLRGKAGTATDAVTIVFDANHPPAGAPSEEEYQGLHIRFAVGYPSADDLIEELIGAESAPAQLTVVSDDRRIRDAARRRGCHVLGGLDYFESTEGTKPPPSQAPQEPNGKPEHVAPEEKERWLQEFGGTENV